MKTPRLPVASWEIKFVEFGGWPEPEPHEIAYPARECGASAHARVRLYMKSPFLGI
jgi:hypothetical protein